MSAATRRDDEPRPDRAEHRVEHARSEFLDPDDPDGGHRTFSSEKRLVAHLAPHRIINLGPFRYYTVFQFFYLECNSRRPERDSGERRGNTEGAERPA